MAAPPRCPLWVQGAHATPRLPRGRAEGQDCGFGHVGTLDRLTILSMAGTCPAMVTGSWTPSMCRTEFPVAQNMTTPAMVNTVWKDTIANDEQNLAAVGVWYGSYCGDKGGEVQVKGDSGTSWACGYYKAMRMRDKSFGCDKDTVCSADAKIESCESVSAMMTAVCTLTADEITAKVAERKTGGYCKDGGLEVSSAAAAVTTAAPGSTPTPKPAAASESSPMWALALAACVFSAVPAVHRNA